MSSTIEAPLADQKSDGTVALCLCRDLLRRFDGSRVLHDRLHRVIAIPMVSVRLRHGRLLAKGQRVIPHNSAPEMRLPPHALSVSKVETVLELPNIATPVGLRNRAMFETLCSCRSQGIGDQRRSGGSEGGGDAEREGEGAE